jgi:hypothetical protein
MNTDCVDDNPLIYLRPGAEDRGRLGVRVVAGGDSPEEG